MNAEISCAERERLVSYLRAGQPHFVKEFTLALDEDLDGEPAVRVSMVVADDEVEGSAFPHHVEQASTWIAEALSASGVQRWPYMSFRGESEVGTTSEPVE